MAVRSPSSWDTSRLAEMLQIIDTTLMDYEAQCYEAANRAPPTWEAYWCAEAMQAHRVRLHMMHRIDEWLRYAKGHNVEVLAHGDDSKRTGRADCNGRRNNA